MYETEAHNAHFEATRNSKHGMVKLKKKTNIK